MFNYWELGRGLHAPLARLEKSNHFKNAHKARWFVSTADYIWYLLVCCFGYHHFLCRNFFIGNQRDFKMFVGVLRECWRDQE